MEERYHEEKARGKLPEEHREWIDGLVGEALLYKAEVRSKATLEVVQLEAMAPTRRRGWGIDWGRCCEGGGGRRLKRPARLVSVLVECEGRRCSGSWTGRFGNGSCLRWTRRRSPFCSTKEMTEVSRVGCCSADMTRGARACGM